MSRLRIAFVLLSICVVAGMLGACSNDNSDDDGDGAATVTQGEISDDPSPTPEITVTSESPEATASHPKPTASLSAAASTQTPTAAPPTSTSTSTATDSGELTLNVYFLRDEHLAVAHRTIARTPAVGSAALEQLLAGPSEREQGIGYSSAVPDGTELLGLEIEDGIAIVDLSGEFESGGGSLSMAARLAQVVYTLTQFPTVDAVQFHLDGEPVEIFGGEGLILDGPVGRDFEDLLPAIFLESPASFDTVESPLTVTGTANVFEATFMVRIVADDGEILTEEVVTATSGSGTRGTFEAVVSFDVEEAIDGMVVVFAYSARDGQPVNVVEVPVRLEP